MSSQRFFRCPVLALILLAVFAMQGLETASAVGIACSYCQHPSCPPWHYSGCRYSGRGLGSSSGSSGSYRGSSGGGEALGNAVSGLIDGFFQSMAEQQQRAAALAAEQRRQQARAAERERQRQEQLRRARIRLAARLRADWDRRDAEIAERLEGVFDVTVATSPSHSLGTGDSPEAEPGFRPEAAVAEPASAPTAQQRLEARLRSRSRYRDVPSPPLQAEIPSDPVTGRLIAIMTNPLSVLPTQGPLHDALRDLAWQTTVEARDHADPDGLRGLGGQMVGDTRATVLKWMGAPGRAWTAYSAQTTFGEKLSKEVSPEMAVALRDGRGLDARGARLGKAQVDLQRDVTGDPSKRHEEYSKSLRALLTGAKPD